jgi:anthranilate synthase/aminodeoxychorismate synthase-like glutamine amidotransferase
MKAPAILVLDNYDSFTFNLVQYLGELGASVEVVRNDEITVTGLRSARIDGLVISPGPGSPADSGVSIGAIRALDGKIPILGVCLGHQCMAAAYGGEVTRARRILHGKTSQIIHGGRGIFHGMENPFTATRYHSLEITRAGLPDRFEVHAWTSDDELMAIKSRASETWGVQFHPESILTQGGKRLIANFLSLCR